MIILFEVGIGTFGYIKQDELNSALDKGFNETLKNYEANQEAWDLVQKEVSRMDFGFKSEIQFLKNNHIYLSIDEMLWS